MNPEFKKIASLIKDADATAWLVRILSSLALGGAVFGSTMAILRLLKVKRDVQKVLSKNIYSEVGEIDPNLMTAITELSRPTNLYIQKKEESLQKEGLERNDLLGPEKLLYDLMNENPEYYGVYPLLMLLATPVLGVATYKVISDFGLKVMRMSAETEAKEKHKKIDRLITATIGKMSKEGQWEWINPFRWLRGGMGLVLGLAALVFFATTPIFYNIFKRQEGKVKDFVRRKAILQKLPSQVPIQFKPSVKLTPEELEELEKELAFGSDESEEGQNKQEEQ